jgi:hypothetical protein
MVDSVKDLGLHRVEVGEAVKVLKLLILHGLLWQRLQVQEVGMGRVQLRQNEVLERDRHNALCSEPVITDGSDVVLWGQWLKDGDGEGQALYAL